jgi:hypothetical protein
MRFPLSNAPPRLGRNIASDISYFRQDEISSPRLPTRFEELDECGCGGAVRLLCLFRVIRSMGKDQDGCIFNGFHMVGVIFDFPIRANLQLIDTRKLILSQAVPSLRYRTLGLFLRE